MDPVLIESVAQRLVTGILVGGIYGLLCAGLGMIFGVVRVINFAQGEFMTLGMYVSLYAAAALIGTLALAPIAAAYAAIVLASVCLAIVGWFVQKWVIAHVSGSRVAGSDNDGHFAQVILTLGLSLVIANGALIAFGTSSQTLRTPLAASSWTLGPYGVDAIMIFVNKARAIGCAVSIVVSFALFVLVQKTRLGTMMRAAADNLTAATIVGIDIERSYAAAFAVGIGATALAGGRMVFEGRDLATVPARARAHLGIAHVPEGRQVFPSLTVMENIEMGAVTKRGRAEWRRTLERNFALFPVLADRKRQLAGTLSGGQQQMLAIARGLAAAPRLLLLDEPSMGLGPVVAEQIFDCIARIHRDEKLTVMLVEQRVAEALEPCDEAHILDAGRCLLSGPPKQLLNDPRVRGAYLGVTEAQLNES